jgi:hypothetical protein
VLGTIGAFLIVVTPVVTGLLGGNLVHYGRAGAATFFLFTAYAISLPWYHAQNHFLVHGRGGDIMKIVIISTLLGLACVAIAIAALGVIGVYVGFMAQTGARSVVAVAFARSRWAISTTLDASLLATALMGAGLAISIAMAG